MVLAGLAVAVAAAACYEAGYVLQALEARESDRALRLRPSLLGRLARRPRWAAGTALSGAGGGLQVLALVLAPLTVVQPTLALGLVALLVLARLVLGERPGRRELLAVAAIVAGVAAVGLAAPPHAGRSPAGPALAIELAVLALLLAAPFVARRADARPRLAVAGAACGDALAALALKLAADELHRGRVPAAAAWAALAAAAGATALTAEMSALQHLPATHVAPVVVALQVLVPVATAPALLGESWHATPGGGLVLGAAVAVVAAAAAVLGSAPVVGGLHAHDALEHDRGGGG